MNTADIGSHKPRTALRHPPGGQTWFGGGGFDPAHLQGLLLSQLKDLFNQVFGEPTASNNRKWLINKLSQPPSNSGSGRNEFIRARDANAKRWARIQGGDAGGDADQAYSGEDEEGAQAEADGEGFPSSWRNLIEACGCVASLDKGESCDELLPLAAAAAAAAAAGAPAADLPSKRVIKPTQRSIEAGTIRLLPGPKRVTKKQPVVRRGGVVKGPKGGHAQRRRDAAPYNSYGRGPRRSRSPACGASGAASDTESEGLDGSDTPPQGPIIFQPGAGWGLGVGMAAPAQGVALQGHVPGTGMQSFPLQQQAYVSFAPSQQGQFVTAPGGQWGVWSAGQGSEGAVQQIMYTSQHQPYYQQQQPQSYVSIAPNGAVYASYGSYPPGPASWPQAQPSAASAPLPMMQSAQGAEGQAYGYTAAQPQPQMMQVPVSVHPSVVAMLPSVGKETSAYVWA